MKTKGVVKQVIYMYGSPGLGKTRLAKSYAEKEKEPYYITGSSRDPFQSYRNQEIVIIDELRPDTFNYSDLLKILDPYNFDVFLPSRYIDKALTARLIVITSPYSPKQLYDYMLHLKNIDSFEQLERRIGTTILVEADTIYHMLYKPETKSYEKHETENFPNPFLSQQGTTNTDNYFQQFAKTFTEKEVLNDNP